MPSPSTYPHPWRELQTKFPGVGKAYHLGKMKNYRNLKTAHGQDFKINITESTGIGKRLEQHRQKSGEPSTFDSNPGNDVHPRWNTRLQKESAPDSATSAWLRNKQDSGECAPLGITTDALKLVKLRSSQSLNWIKADASQIDPSSRYSADRRYQRILIFEL